MKIKALVAGIFLAAASLSASADEIYRSEVVTVTAPSYTFTDVKIGTITINSLSDVVGSVFAATTIGFPAPFQGTFTLDAVSFTGASVGTLTDLDADPAKFSYAGVAAGVYDVIVSGKLLGGGQFNNAAFLGANYTVSAVPEPATYGMLLGGLALVGALARRKQRGAA